MSRRPARRAAPQRLTARRPEPDPEPLAGEDLDEELDYDPDDEDEDLGLADADSFFAAEVSPVEPAGLTLYGRDYVLPATMPLAFALLAERHRGDEGLDTLRTVLGPVFGEDALDHWLASGMDERKLGIVLLWAAQNMHAPGSLGFAEAAREYDAREARGKALNRAQRRAGSGARR